MFQNILLMTDSYKVSHHKQYPPNTNKVYSYLEARKGGEYKEVVFFGLQYFLKRYLAGQVVPQEKIDQAEKFFYAHFGSAEIFNRAGWEHILTHHGGHLPLRIKAVPEGMVVPESNVMMTIENTCDQCSWLTNYIETLLVQVWYGCTTATISREMKKIIWRALQKTGTDTKENLAFKLHDFGYRGVSSPESAAIGGAGHLVNFLGTDTLAACEMLMEYYNSDMPGFSIPAAEHSTITSWGKDRELDAYRNMLERFPTGLVAVVSDSWDVRRAVSKYWGQDLKDKILERDGLLIIRPDSGVPQVIIPELLNILDKAFDCKYNPKGYKLLPDKIRMIQGDGITRDSLDEIAWSGIRAGFSADNLAYGSGGGLLQQCNRDTQRFAMKCSYIEIDGKGMDVFKEPSTDPTKNSKRGRLMLAQTEHGIVTMPEGNPMYVDLLQTKFENGNVLIDHNLNEIRGRAQLCDK